MRGTLDAAVGFLGKLLENGDLPTCSVSRDPLLADVVPVVDLGRLQPDIPFEAASEVFTTATVLLLVAPLQGLLPPLRPLAEVCVGNQWNGRVRYFTGSSRLPGDTDTTAITACALTALGMLDLLEQRRSMIRALASAVATHATGPTLSHVPTVYWDDDCEPHGIRRPVYQDPTVAANVLCALDLDRRAAHSAPNVEAATRFLLDHVRSGAYRRGTRYYPSPEAFLWSVSRLSSRTDDDQRVELLGRARQALRDRIGTPCSALDAARRTIAAKTWGLDTRQEISTIITTQRDNGSWAPCAEYTLGPKPVYFGSTAATAAFCAHALTVSIGMR